MAYYKNLEDRVTNTADIIDSRDIVDRVSELESTLSVATCPTCGGSGAIQPADTVDGVADDVPCPAACDNGVVDLSGEADDDMKIIAALCDEEDNYAELQLLRALVEDIDNTAGDNAEDGVTLVRDSYFEDFARDEAEQLDLIKRDASWPYTCIDWEQAARELQHDYSTVEYDGVTYWVRS